MELVEESAALCLLGRLDPNALRVEGLDGAPDGQAVHLVVQVITISTTVSINMDASCREE